MKRLARLATLAAVAAAIVAAIRALRRDADPIPAPAATPSAPWPPLRAEDAVVAGAVTPDPIPAPDVTPAPNTPVGEAPEGPAPRGPWVEPTADGRCPDGYPIKAKMTSKIFHSPGQLHYDRTTPDRCYVDATAAEADGLRAAMR